jgi:hypothetical protein
LAKSFPLFVSFVSFCEMLLVAALPRCVLASLRLCVDFKLHRSGYGKSGIANLIGCGVLLRSKWTRLN